MTEKDHPLPEALTRQYAQQMTKLKLPFFLVVGIPGENSSIVRCSGGLVDVPSNAKIFAAEVSTYMLEIIAGKIKPTNRVSPASDS